MIKHTMIVSIVLFLGGCASTPDVMYSYYPSCSKSNVTVTQTLDCNNDKSALIVVNSTTVSTLSSADYSKGPYTVGIKKLDGFFADSDITFAFFDDGRLKSVNATTTGQGETVLKSAVTLAAALVPLGAGEVRAEKPTALCAAINGWGGGKPVTLIYTKNIDYGTVNFGQSRLLDPAPDSAGLYMALNKTQPELLPKPMVIVDTPLSVKGGASSSSSAGASVSLTLQETATAKVTVKVLGQNIWSGDITIPGKNNYSLPIPEAALFGKQNFSLTLSEAGAITQIEYGKTTGAAAPLNVATSAATSAKPGSTADRVGEIQAQADLIVQQQRLARCKTDPAQCQ